MIDILLEVFQFDGESGTARSGFTSFAPAVKFNPFKNISPTLPFKQHFTFL